MTADHLGFKIGSWLGGRRIVGYIWLANKIGIRGAWRYERERKRRKAKYGEFVPTEHGEKLLRALGATEEQIAKAKREGLA